jgi:hypothetical protein
MGTLMRSDGARSDTINPMLGGSGARGDVTYGFVAGFMSESWHCVEHPTRQL